MKKREAKKENIFQKSDHKKPKFVKSRKHSNTRKHKKRTSSLQNCSPQKYFLSVRKKRNSDYILSNEIINWRSPTSKIFASFLSTNHCIPILGLIYKGRTRRKKITPAQSTKKNNFSNASKGEKI